MNIKDLLTTNDNFTQVEISNILSLLDSLRNSLNRNIDDLFISLDNCSIKDYKAFDIELDYYIRKLKVCNKFYYNLLFFNKEMGEIEK